MKQESLYRQLADDAFKDAAEEENAQLLAQWKVLGADGWNSRLNPTTPAKKTHWSLGVIEQPPFRLPLWRHGIKSLPWPFFFGQPRYSISLTTSR
jgi:hypothetical protein